MKVWVAGIILYNFWLIFPENCQNLITHTYFNDLPKKTISKFYKLTHREESHNKLTNKLAKSVLLTSMEQTHETGIKTSAHDLRTPQTLSSHNEKNFGNYKMIQRYSLSLYKQIFREIWDSISLTQNVNIPKAFRLILDQLPRKILRNLRHKPKFQKKTKKKKHPKIVSLLYQVKFNIKENNSIIKIIKYLSHVERYILT